MELDDYFEIGYILKPHGLKGAVNVQFDVDNPLEYQEMESVIVKIGNNLVPFLVSSLQITGNKGRMSLQEIGSVEQANELRSATLMLPISMLPKLEDGQFYYHDVIGYTVVDKSEGALGTIEKIVSGSSQDLIAMTYKEKEVLIPVSDEIVERADHGSKEVHVTLPEGLLDIYLD